MKWGARAPGPEGGPPAVSRRGSPGAPPPSPPPPPPGREVDGASFLDPKMRRPPPPSSSRPPPAAPRAGPGGPGPAGVWPKRFPRGRVPGGPRAPPGPPRPRLQPDYDTAAPPRPVARDSPRPPPRAGPRGGRRSFGAGAGDGARLSPVAYRMIPGAADSRSTPSPGLPKTKSGGGQQVYPEPRAAEDQVRRRTAGLPREARQSPAEGHGKNPPPLARARGPAAPAPPAPPGPGPGAVRAPARAGRAAPPAPRRVPHDHAVRDGGEAAPHPSAPPAPNHERRSSPGPPADGRAAGYREPTEAPAALRYRYRELPGTRRNRTLSKRGPLLGRTHSRAPAPSQRKETLPGSPRASPGSVRPPQLGASRARLRHSGFRGSEPDSLSIRLRATEAIARHFGTALAYRFRTADPFSTAVHNGTLLHFGFKAPRLNICYYHQDLQPAAAPNPGPTPRLRRTAGAPPNSSRPSPPGIALPGDAGMADAPRHPFSGLVDSAGIVHHLRGPQRAHNAPPPGREGGAGEKRAPGVRPGFPGRPAPDPPQGPAPGPHLPLRARGFHSGPDSHCPDSWAFQTGRWGPHIAATPGAPPGPYRPGAPPGGGPLSAVPPGFTRRRGRGAPAPHPRAKRPGRGAPAGPPRTAPPTGEGARRSSPSPPGVSGETCLSRGVNTRPGTKALRGDGRTAAATRDGDRAGPSKDGGPPGETPSPPDRPPPSPGETGRHAAPKGRPRPPAAEPPPGATASRRPQPAPRGGPRTAIDRQHAQRG
ncbi:collagen alpha-1(I) chain-like [Zonotrichia leucophrys gambelii]|uniref:collagen alpha-1(I) chain-like n=1 Tax=Zonotrichia leucophrys gambelii TaxID=257770 RepID=UPI0031405CAB